MAVLQVITAREEKTTERKYLSSRTVPCKICALWGLLTVFITLLKLDKSYQLYNNINQRCNETELTPMSMILMF